MASGEINHPTTHRLAPYKKHSEEFLFALNEELFFFFFVNLMLLSLYGTCINRKNLSFPSTGSGLVRVELLLCISVCTSQTHD